MTLFQIWGRIRIGKICIKYGFKGITVIEQLHEKKKNGLDIADFIVKQIEYERQNNKVVTFISATRPNGMKCTRTRLC